MLFRPRFQNITGTLNAGTSAALLVLSWQDTWLCHLRKCAVSITVLGFHFPTCITTELGRGIASQSANPNAHQPALLGVFFVCVSLCPCVCVCVSIPVNFVEGYLQEDGHIPVNYTTEENVSHCLRND